MLQQPGLNSLSTSFTDQCYKRPMQEKAFAYDQPYNNKKSVPLVGILKDFNTKLYAAASQQNLTQVKILMPGLFKQLVKW